MHHRITYMYINFQQNRVSMSTHVVKTVHTNIFAKNCKLHKFATILIILFLKILICKRTQRPVLRSIGLLDINLPQKDIDTDGRTDTDNR